MSRCLACSQENCGRLDPPCCCSCHAQSRPPNIAISPEDELLRLREALALALLACHDVRKDVVVAYRLEQIRAIEPTWLDEDFVMKRSKLPTRLYRGHLTSACEPAKVDLVTKQVSTEVTNAVLKKFTAEIRSVVVEDAIHACYELQAIDIRAAAVCARDRFELSSRDTPAVCGPVPTLYIIRVWQEFTVEVETRRVARMKGEE